MRKAALTIIEEINLDLNRINLSEKFDEYRRQSSESSDVRTDTTRQLDQFIKFFNQEITEEGNIKETVIIVRRYLHNLRARHGQKDLSIPDIDAPYTAGK